MPAKITIRTRNSCFDGAFLTGFLLHLTCIPTGSQPGPREFVTNLGNASGFNTSFPQNSVDDGGFFPKAPAARCPELKFSTPEVTEEQGVL